MTSPSLWSQIYSIHGLGLGASALVAALPIFTLLFLLGVMRKPAWMAGLAGLAVTLLVAIGGYGMPAPTALSAAFYGAAFGLFPISWIIFWAIVLFKITVETGNFDIIRSSLGHLTPDPRLQALLIAFAFSAFLEGGAGFGTPVAIAATMLTGLGFSAFSASAVCLLANTAPVAFGSIGIPVITLAGTTGLPLDQLSAAVGRFCAPISLILPLYILVATGGFGALDGVWLPAILAGVVFSGMQITISTFVGPQLTDILAALSVIVVLVLYLRLRPQMTQEQWATANLLTDGRKPHPGLRMQRAGLSASESEQQRAAFALLTHTPAEIVRAWLPYGLLVLCVLLWGIAPIQRLLNRATSALPWPGLDNMVLRMPPITAGPSPYHALFTFNPLSASGTACMVATFLSILCLGVSLPRFVRILRATLIQMALPIATVAIVLAVGFLMNYCGATATLGLAFASTGVLFPFFSSLLGFLGVFLTGSDTSSNALFGNLQVVTAGRLGLSPVLMAAANSAGGVMGKMISLQTIAVAAAATGLSVKEQAKLFRFTLRHSILLAGLVGGLALLYTYTFHL